MSLTVSFPRDGREIATGSLTSVCCRFVPGQSARIDAHPGRSPRATLRTGDAVSMKTELPATADDPPGHGLGACAGRRFASSTPGFSYEPSNPTADSPAGWATAISTTPVLHCERWRFWASCMATWPSGPWQFLRSRLQRPEKLIDHMSLVFGAALLDAAAGLDVYGPARRRLERPRSPPQLMELRREDGGFAKGAGRSGQQHLLHVPVAAVPGIDRAAMLEDHKGIVDFIMSQRDAELGGFREIRVSKRAGTNPTAAAIGVLRMLDALDDDIRHSTADFLADMQDDDGGLLANSRIPLADVLSTFTGMLTLADLDRMDAINTSDALHFVHSVQQAEGGFLGAAWDEACDVEYTFYGLGCLALLSWRRIETRPCGTLHHVLPADAHTASAFEFSSPSGRSPHGRFDGHLLPIPLPGSHRMTGPPDTG